jgi:flagellar biosynthesis protein FliP
MSNDDSPDDYDLWVQLANDPSQTQDARRHYRALMETYVHEQLREAFRLAAEQTPPR